MDFDFKETANQIEDYKSNLLQTLEESHNSKFSLLTHYPGRNGLMDFESGTSFQICLND